MTAETGAAPADGAARVAHFLAAARKQRFRSTDAAGEALRFVSARSIEKWESAKDDRRVPTPRKARYAKAIAGWGEQDLIDLYDGGDPPPIRPQWHVGGKERPAMPEGLEVTADQQAQAISRIWTWTDLPLEARRYMTDLLAEIPVVESAQQPTGPREENDSSAHAG